LVGELLQKEELSRAEIEEILGFPRSPTSEPQNGVSVS
jgi:hypothetical protein